ncbi:hypothetical protein CerSpe_086800 [Prunus speciosa]
MLKLPSLRLSEQQLVDGDNTLEGWLEGGERIPLHRKRGECKFNPDKAVVKVANFTTFPMDEDQIAANLVHYGPLAIGLNAMFMQTYIRGISCPLICFKKWVNHGVLLVGLLRAQVEQQAILDHQEFMG